MKAIELTQDQKVKLIEMCEVLFPELIFSWDLSTIGNGILFYRSPYKYFGCKIHWFEFCMTHLLRNICIERTNKDFGFDPWAFDKTMKKSIIKCLMYDDPEHPIDYLYQEFKKLK